MSANTEITPWHLRVNGQDGIDSEDAMMSEITELRAALAASSARIEDLTTADNRCINDALGMGQQSVTQNAGSGEVKPVLWYDARQIKPHEDHGVLIDNVRQIAILGTTEGPFGNNTTPLYAGTAPPSAVQPNSGDGSFESWWPTMGQTIGEVVARQAYEAGRASVQSDMPLLFQKDIPMTELSVRKIHEALAYVLGREAKADDTLRELLWSVQNEFHKLQRAIQPDSGRDAVIKVAPEPFILGNRYRTQGGRFVRFVGVANEGTSYETMYDELGHHRYTKRDFGRCTGASWDDDCVPPLYTYPLIQPQVSNKL